MKVIILLAILVIMSMPVYADAPPATLWQQVWENNHDGVVQISGHDESGSMTGLGSGWVWRGGPDDKYSFVITNRHVARDAGVRIWHRDISSVHPRDYKEPATTSPVFALKRKQPYLEGRVLTYDEKNDIAVLAVENLPDSIPGLDIEPSEDLVPGMDAIAIGYPLGLWESLTTGVISSVDADIGLLREDYEGRVMWISDTQINVGNSGGPILNTNGDVIGMACASLTRRNVPTGVNLMVPSDRISDLIEATISEYLNPDLYLRFDLG